MRVSLYRMLVCLQFQIAIPIIHITEILNTQVNAEFSFRLRPANPSVAIACTARLTLAVCKSGVLGFAEFAALQVA